MSEFWILQIYADKIFDKNTLEKREILPGENLIHESVLCQFFINTLLRTTKRSRQIPTQQDLIH
jgi:hypothetical protein